MQPIGIATVLGAWACGVPALGQLVFFEDFESYAPGSDLVGQGGWTFAGPPHQTVSPRVNLGVGLSTQVMDGHSFVGGTGGSRFVRELPSGIEFSSRAALTFDAFAFSAGPPTQAWTMGFAADPVDNPGAVYWAAIVVPGEPRWVLVGPNGLVVESVAGSSSFDRPIQLGITLDLASSEYWGTYDVGAGPIETGHHAITSGGIAALQYLQGYLYFPSGDASRGGELDNIRLRITVPETETWLGGMALACMGFLSYCRVRRLRAKSFQG